MEVADANDMVVLFPSTVARALIANPYGCFNWYGYLGDLGRQSRAPSTTVQIHCVTGYHLSVDLDDAEKIMKEA